MKSKMSEHNQQIQILFFHYSITCIYFIGILIYLNVGDKLDNIGIYKFFAVLSILILIEFIKLFFTIYQLNRLYLQQLKSKTVTKIMKDIMKIIIAIIVITIIYHISIILYGAPLLSHCEKTLLLAFTLTVLTLIPAIIHLGIDDAISLFTDSQFQIEGALINTVKLNIKTVLLATWLSAFVLPLDWNQPWQVWPIPCIMGALLGYFIAHFITFIKILIMNFRKKSKQKETLKNC